jgi:diacylglycerol O-acyltransferase
MVKRQRLGGQDALWLEMDKPGNLMVVDSLFWTAAPVDWDRYHRTVRERLWDRFPVFRSVVVRSDDGWYWEERSDADYDARYRHVVLPEPGGDAELQDLISAQRTVPLDRSEPLWSSVLVDGYRGGSAVLLRAHHSIADGIRMVQLSLSMFDADPDGSAVPASTVRSHQPARKARGSAPDPTVDRPSLTSQARSLTASLGSRSLQIARTTLTNPVGAAHSALTLSESLVGKRPSLGLPGFLAAVPGDVDTARKLALGTRNDTTVWTGKVGPHKSVGWAAPLFLDEVKEVARVSGSTVNDVLVTCVAESLRAYLQKHDAVCHSVNWDVPVNLKPFDPSLPVVLGNSFALVQLELPTHIEDPLHTLEVVRHRMSRIKDGHEAVVDFGIQAAISRLSSRLYRATIDLLANRAVGVLTNVPGPRVPLYVAGQKIEGMLGWAPTTADQVMSFTIYSYNNLVFVGIAADTGLVPDHEQIVDGFTDAFHRLSLLVR